MISYLKGKIIEIDFVSLTILTNSGVGYEVGINNYIYEHIISQNSLNKINSKKIDLELYIYHHITENSQSLFGFLQIEEKKFFKELIKISGIGGKVAMQILSLGIEKLITAVGIQDNKTIESVKGVGKKMAEKIILEFKDKKFDISFSSGENQENTQKISESLYYSIKETLTNMGYNQKDIDKILNSLPAGMKEAGDILQYVIKELS